MKTATVRELRNRLTTLLRWIEAGEEVAITRNGIPVARLVPTTTEQPGTVDWTNSPEVTWDRSGDTWLTAEQSAALIAEAGGKW